MAESHSYGPTCAFYESDDEPEATSSLSAPKVKAQFFYVSLLPLDDPLSPLPPATAEQPANVPPQPFSSRDNAALEESWQGLRDIQEEFKARPGSRGLQRMFSFPKFRSGQVVSPEVTSPVMESFNPMVTATLPDKRSRNNSVTGTARSIRKSLSRSQSPEIRRKPSERVAANQAKLPVATESQVMLNQDTASTTQSVDAPLDSSEIFMNGHEQSTLKRPKHHSPIRRRHLDRFSRENSPARSPSLAAQVIDETNGLMVPQAEVNNSISGRPFARAPSKRQLSSSALLRAFEPTPNQEATNNSSPDLTTHSPETERKKVFVPVGVSRLHLVEFPDLTMKPIYWSPINDTSAVMRATWFYKESMLPVPADIANRLEIGYEDMKPYSDTYQDELNACVDHGASAELKVVHKLWPEDRRSSRPNSAMPDKTGEQELGADTADLPENPENIAADSRKKGDKKRLFASHSVIYADHKNAQILRPSALPSTSRNRRPLNAIRKGRQIGIAVVRGFDRQLWNKLHPDPKKTAVGAHATAGAKMSRSGDATTRSRRMSCHVCDEESTKPKVTDLVLVIHGIGQKLSERVDSYNFTLAVNGLRREFNVQQSQDSTKRSLKIDSGVMVLPVNWRLTVSFDEESGIPEAEAENKYKLGDITPETLPAVRSLISDVMLDIPYYMSHHKQKMIAAVIREANRVYRLWCRNNPGFQDYGRVHLIAHSLGSAMAVDILSQQPTNVPPELELTKGVPSEKMFEFDTTNLFCCGSPSGFFLLLNGANLVPRKGRRKPGMENEDAGNIIAAEAGQYGCLAVDNLYNIMHKNDPIAYQQNACVDSTYAALLQPANIPPATQSFFSRLGDSLRWSSHGATSMTDAYGHATPLKRPTVQSIPSTVELETHNFTREEIAEKRMYLLNDNGQIDYFLQSGGGPLEIQYLNMLSAHSSYWILQDFVRFLVVEIGREPGRENTLPVLRAVKRREFKRGEGF